MLAVLTLLTRIGELENLRTDSVARDYADLITIVGDRTGITHKQRIASCCISRAICHP